MQDEPRSGIAANFEMTPSLQAGALAEAGLSLVAAARTLGRRRLSTILRGWSVPFLFDAMERIFATGADPLPEVQKTVEELAQCFRQVSRTGFNEIGGADDAPGAPMRLAINNARTVTGEHYGRLFERFSKTSFWDEPRQLLSARLGRNALLTSQYVGKSVLDAGCGGGRYTIAWRLLGASRAVGIDASYVAIADATRRVPENGLEGVGFLQGDVLKLPCKDSTFDVVFSNGVLHHSTDWRAGIGELLRVLKPGGLGWVYLIENPGGLFWDLIELLRVVTRDDEASDLQRSLRILGLPANRIYYMLDHVKAPINLRLRTVEIEECLAAASACKVRRLERGTDFDRIERIYRREPYAEIKYGVGENRYLFSKD
jgi:SAM-dependent methyltransferase